MKLSVPFLSDEKYTNFLKNETGNIASLHFPFTHAPRLDARVQTAIASWEVLLERLSQLDGLEKYALLNTRFIHPEKYFDNSHLHIILDRLEILCRDCGLTGIVFTDAYFLNALSGTGHPVVSGLEAVPGINCMIDSPAKAAAILQLIDASSFKRPRKLVLDRSLNRDFSAIKTLRQQFPDLQIELLANEGCLSDCPFKPAHDAQIAFVNAAAAKEMTFAVNQAMGCRKWLFEHPWQIMRSPFIRPEDLEAYQGAADTIKLCGRTLGTGFLTRCISAYIARSWEGNLLDLLDASGWLADLWHIDNQKLDLEELKQASLCTKDCKGCNMCRDLFSKSAAEKRIGLKNYKDYT